MSRPVDAPDPYELRERPPGVETFQRLRAVNDMAPRPREGVERGLANTEYAAVVVHGPTDETVAMGRVLGDGGAVFHVTDMAVHPDHQREGLGTAVMDALMAHVEANAAPGAYVNLMADVEGFYERWGFEPVRPVSRGMYRRTE